MRLRTSVFVLSACLLRAAHAADPAIWSSAYDPAAQTRYIPLELILGADWKGKQHITLPEGRFQQSASTGATTWDGPVDWRHRDTQETLRVYERRRRGVFQRMAVRKDGQAIGRVFDSRFDLACDQEAKFPLGHWKQGETRIFEYPCTNGEGKPPRTYQATITIDRLDFTNAGVEHSLQIRWTLKIKDTGRELDNRIYVWSPGLSMVRGD